MSADGEWGGIRAYPADFIGSDARRELTTAQRREKRLEDGDHQEQVVLEESIYGEQSWSIPGMGEQPASCGRWYHDRFCENGHLILNKSSCELRDCPECWWKWNRQRSGKIMRRLGAARLAAEENADKRAVHAVVSPPPGSITTKQELYDAFTDAYELATEHGVRGGACIFHGYRATDAARAEFARAKERGEEAASFGLWRWIRENDRHWRDQVYWSPHWHFVGLARFEDTTEGDTEADDGWLFKKIRTLERFTLTDPSGYEDMARVTRYLLSHVTYEPEENKHSIRWFGELSYQKFAPEEAVSSGVWRTLERNVDEALGYRVKDEGQAELEEFAEETCSHDGCEGETYHIWEAGELLQQKRFCKHIGQERERRLLAAFKWSIGEVVPPPGLRYPTSAEEAEEALEALL